MRRRMQGAATESSLHGLVLCVLSQPKMAHVSGNGSHLSGWVAWLHRRPSAASGLLRSYPGQCASGKRHADLGTHDESAIAL